MEKIDKPEKKEGRDVMSSSYDNWNHRIEKGGEGFNQRINDQHAKGK